MEEWICESNISDLTSGSDDSCECQYEGDTLWPYGASNLVFFTLGIYDDVFAHSITTNSCLNSTLLAHSS